MVQVRIERRQFDNVPKLLVVAVVVIVILVHLNSGEVPEGESFITMKEIQSDGNVRVLHEDLSPNGDATLVLELTRSESDRNAIAVGEHNAKVLIKNADCKFPRFWIRLVGKTLVPVLLRQEKKSKQTWTGSFTVPLEGTYAVDTRWYGCTKTEKSWTPLHFPIELRAVGEHSILENRPKEVYLFSDSAWMSTKNNTSVDMPPEYMWMDPNKVGIGKDDFINVEKKKGFSTMVSKSATLKEPKGIYKFVELGNYELVCFWGSKTVEEIRQRFLAIRPNLAPQQRPFKFHYYNVSNLVHPDAHWPQSKKQTCRKCKHIIFSVDEFDTPLSQAEYKNQITAHIEHLQKLLGDSTFPIWILSVNEPPMHATSTCHSPTLPRSTDHPCNDVLQSMFQPGKEAFSGRQVHFLDNTDLTLPQFDENRGDVLTNIAMRIYVVVGKGVSDWRKMGQAGKVDGLHRNGTVEPNFELVPYDGWNS